ncbi:MAG: hypothetical protein J6J77_01155 [Alistipes sp.]|nr:hypothetical protein [Alistipes sp.]
MKKLIFVMAALSLAFVGCNTDKEFEQPVENKALKVVVNMDKPSFGDDTRAARTDWEDGDEVVVTIGNNIAYYCLILTYDGTSKKWTTTVMEPNLRTGVFVEGSISTIAYDILGDATEVSSIARAAYFSSGVAEIFYGNLSAAASTRASATNGLIIVTNAGRGCSWKGGTPSVGDHFGECIMICRDGGFTLKETDDSYELTLDITMQPMVAQFTIRDLKVEDDWSIWVDAPMTFAAGGYFTERGIYLNAIEYQNLGYCHQNGNDISIYAVPWQSNDDIPSGMLPGGVDLDTVEENFYTTCPYNVNIHSTDYSIYFERNFGVKGVLEAGDAVIVDGPYTSGAEDKWE